MGVGDDERAGSRAQRPGVLAGELVGPAPFAVEKGADLRLERRRAAFQVPLDQGQRGGEGLDRGRDGGADPR